MKRVLVIRLLALELAPMVAALAVSAYSQRLMPAAFLIAGFIIFTSVVLTIRDGAVWARGLGSFGGVVCERRNDRGGFWFWVCVHFLWAGFFLSAGAIMFVWPRPI
jgi:hypothetical protein